MIIFNEKAHSYTSILGDPYTSVTTKIGKYKPDIDWDKKAENYVKKHKSDINILVDLANKASLTMEEAELKFGTTFSKERIREIWKMKGANAARGGTTWHNWMEKQDSGRDNAVYIPLVNGEKEAIDLSKIEPNKVYLEMMLYNNKAKICGQADRVFTFDNTSEVRDWKTVNKDLVPEVIAYWQKVGNRNKQVQAKFKKPLNVLYNSYWEYAMQLSMYGYMLETYGFPPRKKYNEAGDVISEGLVIDQVLTDWVTQEQLEDNIVIDYDSILKKYRIVTDVIEIHPPYLKEEVKKILK